MRFDLFQTRADAHVRKAREYLQQANLARLEHQAAAEHHAALAAMYTQRARWLEQELSAAATNTYAMPYRGQAPKQVDGPKRAGPSSVVSWLHAQTIDGEHVPESA